MVYSGIRVGCQTGRPVGQRREAWAVEGLRAGRKPALWALV